jgi:hypothetical protein
MVLSLLRRGLSAFARRRVDHPEGRWQSSNLSPRPAPRVERQATVLDRLALAGGDVDEHVVGGAGEDVDS